MQPFLQVKYDKLGLQYFTYIHLSFLHKPNLTFNKL